MSAAYPPSPPLPSSKPTALGSPSSQSSRLQASALSITSNSQQFDKVYAAYTDPAGRPSARRSISVGRRTSSDIAASVGRAGDLGIGSLGARSQPLQPLTSATAAGETRATAAGLARSSSRSKAYQETASSSMQPAQQDAEMRVGADARMHAYPSSMSTSSVAGRSSLIGRRGSRSLLQDEGLSTRVQVRAGGMTPSISESASELSSGAPVLSRCSLFQLCVLHACAA